MFGRKRLTAKINDLTSKINALTYRKTDGAEARELLWNDQIHPPMPRTIVKQQIDPKNPSHRAAQLRSNIHAFKMTKGIAEKLFAKRPYPFSFVKPYNSDSNGEETDPEGESLQPAPEDDRAEFQPKSNGFPREGELDGESIDPLERSPILDSPQTTYEVRADLNPLYEQWRLDDMFYYAEEALGDAFGEGSSFICRTTDGKFWVFGQHQILKVKGKQRHITQIQVDWPILDSRYEEEGVGQIVKGTDKKDGWFTIGKDAVMCQPYPWIYDIFGWPLLSIFWDSVLNKQLYRFLNAVYLFKGGIVSKYNRYPSNLDDDVLKRLESIDKQGLIANSMNIPFPPGSNPEHVDKLFQHDEIVNGVDFDAANSLLSEDNTFPKSFIEGQVESGALGGSAPEMDKTKEDEQLLRMFRPIDRLVKDINATFYAVEDEAYIVVPWQNDKGSTVEGDPLVAPDETDPLLNPEDIDPKDDPVLPKEEESPKKRPAAKFNSMTPLGLHEYDAVLLPIGEWPYPTDDNPDHTEIIDMETVNEYYNDPLTLKEGYFQEEHPESPQEVIRANAIGKYQITGVSAQGLMGKIITNTYLGKDFSLSNFYYSNDAKATDGKIHHRRIDFRNVVKTSHPRMGKATAKYT